MTWLFPVLAAGLYTVRATPLSRLRFWWSWSPPYAVWSLSITAIVLYINAILGPLAVSRGMTSHIDWSAVLVASFAAPGVTRKGASQAMGRGTTLALGTLGEVQGWFRALLADEIRQWAEKLDDDALDRAAATIDRKRTGRRPSSTARARLREERRRDMKQAGTIRDEIRADMIDAIVDGYIAYEIPRPK